tara:strand:+ start:547 stop:783 length:237 start_codon:yes stop_codon:yes gene_type:complete
MSSRIKVYAENEHMTEVNSFVSDLQALMEKHGVWMNAEQDVDEDYPVVEFLHIANENDETDWWVEMVDLWPDSAVTLR